MSAEALTAQASEPRNLEALQPKTFNSTQQLPAQASWRRGHDGVLRSALRRLWAQEVNRPKPQINKFKLAQTLVTSLAGHSGHG